MANSRLGKGAELTRDQIVDLYFDWLVRLVTHDRRILRRRTFRKLLTQMHSTEFYYILPMDENRAADGASMRDKFAWEMGLDWHITGDALEGPCSVFEMIAAMSKKCADFMCEEDEDDPTPKWFFYMLENAGLDTFDDRHYDKDAVADILKAIMDRNYRQDGSGGLFYAPTRNDMQTVELWYQMMYWLDYYIHGRR